MKRHSKDVQIGYISGLYDHELGIGSGGLCIERYGGWIHRHKFRVIERDLSEKVMTYRALCALLGHFRGNLPCSDEKIVIRSHDEMVIKQMNGIWRANQDKKYIPDYKACMAIVDDLPGVIFELIDFAENQSCLRMVRNELRGVTEEIRPGENVEGG